MKRALPPYVYARRSRGRTYHYFERWGERTRLPDPADPGFYAAYTAALRPALEPAGETFGPLMDSYYISDRFRRLARSSQDNYRTYIEKLRPVIGDKTVKSLTRPLVRKIQTANAGKIGVANRLVTVIGILCEHAIDQGLIEHNPAKGVRMLAAVGEDKHKAWPDDVRERFEANATPRARIAYELCIGTGQRIGDVLRMRWSDIHDDAIHLRQQKTGAELVIPLTGRLRAFLAGVERVGEYIVAKNLRRAWGYKAIATDFKAAGGWTIHGLRYTAAAELAAHGCSDEEIMAITGHTSRVIMARYAGKARQIARARAAQSRRNRTSPERES